MQNSKDLALQWKSFQKELHCMWHVVREGRFCLWLFMAYWEVWTLREKQTLFKYPRILLQTVLSFAHWEFINRLFLAISVSFSCILAFEWEDCWTFVAIVHNYYEIIIMNSIIMSCVYKSFERFECLCAITLIRFFPFAWFCASV